jgi:hypothetical protein
MSDDRKSSKIYIPHTKDEGCNIAGILEQLDAGGDTRGRPIALVHSSSVLTVLVLRLSISSLSSSFTVPWGIFSSPPHTERALTCDQPQRLRLPEEVGAATAHRFLPIRFPVNVSPLTKGQPQSIAYQNNTGVTAKPSVESLSVTSIRTLRTWTWSSNT